MTAHTVIRCDGLRKGAPCQASSPLFRTCIVSFARELAAAKGWSTRQANRSGDVTDLCPTCAPFKAPPTRYAKWQACPPGAPCSVLGHDAVGHRVAAILYREDMSLEEIAACTYSDLTKIAGLGRACIARIKKCTKDMR
ncbi:hypothetical protein AB0O47_39320 [Streptomyces noursei]|uniref:hypothetical protein n=1 Tax=Streptomyces noursei TaxID=1971 RepID=UPI00344D001B